uniref:Uncharacterized protein n=1 Tax=Acrobeloides nanus TaxID=290746 RepID=A0A914DJ16_9BILA
MISIAGDILVYQYLVTLLDSHTMRFPSSSAFKKFIMYILIKGPV